MLMSRSIQKLNARMSIIHKYITDNAPILDLSPPDQSDVIAESAENDVIPKAFISKLKKLRNVI